MSHSAAVTSHTCPPLLPDAGFVRINQLLKQPEVTVEQAEANRKLAAYLRAKYPSKSDQKKLASELAKVGPRTPRAATPGIIPWSKSKLWDAVSKGEFPAPVKLSARTTAWPISSVRAFLAKYEQKVQASETA